MNKQINIGWAQTDITPDRPVYVIGQLYSRISSYVHDPITATCLVLENGEEQMTMVSCDMGSVPVNHIAPILERVNVPGLDKSHVVFNVIHTHNSSRFPSPFCTYTFCMGTLFCRSRDTTPSASSVRTRRL